MLIQEVILENFMSYEYARIPIKPGLNIVCGPNGSGKSSILLAISVALGQAYTERSRKLSDLVRWGKDNARVTIVFDNTSKNRKRPVPRFDVDYLRFSRYLKKDGNYWFEANFQSINKSEVTSILNEFGIDPDNMLIMMHQHMMEEFGIITPKQKLSMVEEAVGLGEYRKSLLEAQEKLSHVLSEEESVKNLLENAEQTLTYWREEYEKYKRQKELVHRREFLGRELIWSQFNRQEEVVYGWKKKIGKREDDLNRLLNDITKSREAIKTVGDNLNTLNHEQYTSYYSLLALEKEKTECEVTIAIYDQLQNKMKEFNISQKRSTIGQINDIENYMLEMISEIASSKRRLKDVEKKGSIIQSGLTQLGEKLSLTTKNFIDERVHEGLLNFQRELAEDEIKDLNRELRAAERELEQLTPLLEKVGIRIKTERAPQEVSEEIKITNVEIMALGEVSLDVEKMFFTYSNLYNELKEKAIIVSENRKITLVEVEARKQTWKRLVQSLLEDVSSTYQTFLSRIDATGYVRLTNSQDIEVAGLELVVGFKGSEPTILDSYTQSGGERSAATMAFLLALQQHVKSPFRAVDEFDVHMDPRNREVFSDLLFNEIGKNRETQYLVITPSQISRIYEDVHVITVQNVEGRSEVKVVE